MATVVDTQKLTACQSIGSPSTPQKHQQRGQPDTPTTCAGTPSTLSSTLRSRITVLMEIAQASQSPSLKLVWPEGVQPAMQCSGTPADEAVWQDILVKFGAGRASGARDADHFEDVIRAGMDANSVAFPNKSPRRLAGQLEVAVPCQDAVPFPLPQSLAQQWTTEDEQEIVELVIAGLAEGPQDLRTAFYRTPALDMELVPWAALQDGVVQADECTYAQLRVLAERSKHTLSPHRLEKRRAALAVRLKGDLNPCVFTEIRPVLECEAALLELQAGRARDKAKEARQFDELAEKGASLVAWVVPNERRWPQQSAAWRQRGKWLEMWRARPLIASAFAFQPMKRSDSVSSLSSWAAVSDVSWVELESKASDCGWQEFLEEQEPSLLEADPSKHLKKADITEIKSLSKPPQAVQLAMEVICILLEVAPIKLQNGEVNYWEAAKKLLGQADFLAQLSALRFYVAPSALNAVAPYMSSEDFTPLQLRKSSLACAGLCTWAREIYKYHVVAQAAAEAAQQQVANKSASELLMEAEATLNMLKKADIQELKALGKPPRGVCKVGACLLHLFAGIAPSVELTKEGRPKDASWGAFQKLAGNPTGFMQQLLDFKDAIDTGKVPRKNIQGARRVQLSMGSACNAKTMARLSCAAAGLVSWLINIIAYYELAAPKQPDWPENQVLVEPKQATLLADIQELKALSNPPRGVIEVLQAVCLLLGSSGTLDWRQCRSMMGCPTVFLDRLAHFDIENVSPSALTSAKSIARRPDFSCDALAKKNKAIVGLAEWVLEVAGLRQKS